MGSTENIVLAQPDDWEQWIAEIQAMSDEDIWPHIDPGHPAPERALQVEPEELKVEQFDRNAQAYAQMTAVM
jgi:hypothetical protein